MTRAVWKYQLPVSAESAYDIQHEVPNEAHVLHVAVQYDEVCVWMEVDPNQPKSTWTFRAIGTGHEFEDQWLSYLGTTLHTGGILVLHWYTDFGWMKGDGNE